MKGSDVPFLPRGVRTHYDDIRKTEVLLAPERVLMLDAVGTAVLSQMDGQSSLDQISANLSEVYDAPLDVIAPDVSAFVEDLRNKGMVHIHES